MNPEELATLKAFVLASQDAAIQAAAASRNDTQLSKLLNLPSAFAVWRIDVPTTELVGAIKLASFTPSDTPDNTLLYNNRCALCELKQNSVRLLLAREVITSQKLSTRQDLMDALTGVPAGPSGTAVDAGWLGAGKVKATITRFATVAETAFATGTGTVAQPGDLGWEGQMDVALVGRMWSN